MDTSRIEEIIGIAEKWDLDALEVEDEAGAVRVVRRSGGQYVPAAPAAQQAAGGDAGTGPDPQLPDGVVAVKSPTVGIFSCCGADGSSQPVQCGDAIQAGQPLGYVEAMKMATEVQATVCGTLVELLAAEGQAVEFGTPLFLIKIDPDGE